MATKTDSAAKSAPSAGVPNQTLYIKNLPDKIKKPDLRLSLYTLFSTYGVVLDVVAMRGNKMRGQAHVVFRDVQASTQAMRSLDGFNFYGKEMKIVYGKGASDIIAKLRGTYNTPTAPGAGVSTELQKSIFSGPPAATSTATSLPSKPVAANGSVSTQAPQGLKRPREDESDEEDAPMDEDDDSDAPMDASSDED